MTYFEGMKRVSATGFLAGFLGDLAAIGFAGLGRVPDDQHPSRIHLGQMGGSGGFFMGVLRHGDLINQALLRGLKVHQGQGLFGFGFLPFGRSVHRLGQLGSGPHPP